MRVAGSPIQKPIRKWIAESAQNQHFKDFLQSRSNPTYEVRRTGGGLRRWGNRNAPRYVRVNQSVENQVRELKQVAERRGWTVEEVYRDAGISGAKGRDKLPGLDAMLKDASRRKFDLVMAWAIGRARRRERSEC